MATIQIPGGRNRFPKIIVDFFEYIHQGTGNRHAIGYREADPIVLPRIWIYRPEDNDFYLLKRACVKYMEYLGPGRKYVRLLIFVFDKCDQLLEIRLVKFFLQTCFLQLSSILTFAVFFLFSSKGTEKSLKFEDFVSLPSDLNLNKKT